MNGNWKRALLGSLALSSLIFVAQAKAVIVIPPPYAPLQIDLAIWDADPQNQVLQQDKLWTLIGYTSNLVDGSNPNNPLPARFSFVDIAGVENHILTLGDSTSNYIFTAGTYDIHYSLQIVGDPTRYIDSASLGVDIGGHPGVTVTKTLRDINGNLVGAGGGGTTPGLLTSVDGVGDSTSLAVRYLDVFEHIVVTGTGAVFSTTDTYTQATPEPASLAIWGSLGAVGLVVGWRKNRNRKNG
jgi:hypothetical protein